MRQFAVIRAAHLAEGVDIRDDHVVLRPQRVVIPYLRWDGGSRGSATTTQTIRIDSHCNVLTIRRGGRLRLELVPVTDVIWDHIRIRELFDLRERGLDSSENGVLQGRVVTNEFLDGRPYQHRVFLLVENALVVL